MYLTKLATVVVTPAIPGKPGRPAMTVCAPPSPAPPRPPRHGGAHCTVVCAPREDIGMGGTTTICRTVCT